MVNMKHVESSNIEAIGYDPDAQELHIRFLSGTAYIYHKVPQEAYDNLMAAPSKGTYLNRAIKSTYEYSKV